MIKAEITVSCNPLISDDSWIPESLRKVKALPMLRILAKSRKGTFYTISGFWVQDEFIAYPLFSSHGHKRYQISKAEYNALVDNAPISIDKFCTIPEGFERTVAELESEIRAHLRRE